MHHTFGYLSGHNQDRQSAFMVSESLLLRHEKGQRKCNYHKIVNWYELKPPKMDQSDVVAIFSPHNPMFFPGQMIDVCCFKSQCPLRVPQRISSHVNRPKLGDSSSL